MAHLPNRWKLAIEFFAEMADQFALWPGKPVIIDADGKQTLLVPALALDLIRVAAVAAVTLGSKPHAGHF